MSARLRRWWLSGGARWCAVTASGCGVVVLPMENDWKRHGGSSGEIGNSIRFEKSAFQLTAIRKSRLCSKSRWICKTILANYSKIILSVR
ncbi:hypothetical protein L1987_15567 [Smallanthus sonchifolius]|uniref:Uncharacterized protein n=1 Tax=Smallanthus sonchifolius TaxID=185202 RepID=A0ACB9J6S6_9ASTR|nr:hypothetical protein L1987_15567 [Smallanthus sonchifolius]